MWVFRPLARTAGRRGAHAALDGAGHLAGAEARTAAEGAAAPLLQDAARAAAPEAARVDADLAKTAVSTTYHETISRAYVRPVLKYGTYAAGGAVAIHKAEGLLRDGGGALKDEFDDFAHGLGNLFGGLGRGLSQGLTGPAKTAVEAASAAVVVGGVIFTAYGTYRLFR